jgi:NADH:ubiquinone oxidoreductase subunit 5 (subunit L)/multisubunit Na+/H+ antiporter MnhA subunit
MRKMGGLIKKMPVTALTFLVGVLAIAGTGIPGLHIGDTKFGLGGFFSKDEILAVAYARTNEWTDYHNFEESEHADAGVGDSPVMLASMQEGHVTQDAGHADEHAAPGEHAAAAPHEETGGKAAIFSRMPKLPSWMYWLAIATAYVTPFYMMRCWWMTFMGKPRDEHVHHHAHESKLMYVPLVVLAVGTFVASYWLFRHLIAEAAPAATTAPMVLAFDGTAHSPAISSAHHALVYQVGFAFAVGFAIAIAIYRNGLGLADRIKNVFPISLLHTLLEKKYFFDEVYDFVWIKGCLLVAAVARFIDTWIIDLLANLAASITERIAALSGNIIDAHGVDGIVNGIARTTWDAGGVMRRPQTGRIRNYVLSAVAVATVVVIGILYFGLGSRGT